MMYYAKIGSPDTNPFSPYDQREQRIAVYYGSQTSQTPKVVMTLDKKYFIQELHDQTRDPLNKILGLTLEFILLSGTDGKEVILLAQDCNLGGIDKLKKDDEITLWLIDPETTLARGGGWAISEVLAPDGQPLYLSPGIPRYRDLY